jgi:cell pole-organizing protein PopZ
MSADNNDPSMDDILASIRKIISDDEARAQVSGNATPATPPANMSFEPRPTTGTRAGATANREDVLLLTDLIEEPKLGTPSAEPEAPTPLPVPRIDPARASEMPQPIFDPQPMQVPTPAFEPSLVASSVAGATASAFDRLNQVVEERKAAPASDAAPMPSLPLGNGGKTIEDLVKEMLRPMLKDWIDRSLPPMVERLVEREIARLTRR